MYGCGLDSWGQKFFHSFGRADTSVRALYTRSVPWKMEETLKEEEKSGDGSFWHTHFPSFLPRPVLPGRWACPGPNMPKLGSLYIAVICRCNLSILFCFGVSWNPNVCIFKFSNIMLVTMAFVFIFLHIWKYQDFVFWVYLYIWT